MPNLVRYMSKTAMSSVASIFSEQVVGQFGTGIESLLGAFQTLEDATGGHSDGLNSALDNIKEPVESIGGILKEIEPVVDIIRKVLA